jgi:disulfide bond formation protein DsbB
MNRASLPAERILLALGLGSLALILGALGFQYLGHIKPCEMCHWQRWPHIAAAFLGIGGVSLARRQARNLAWIVVFLIAVSGLIGAYQSGMQMGILPGPQACSVAHPYVMGSNVEPEVQCNVVTWSLFGLSLATYNAMFSFLLAGTAAVLLGKRK